MKKIIFKILLVVVAGCWIACANSDRPDTRIKAEGTPEKTKYSQLPILTSITGMSSKSNVTIQAYFAKSVFNKNEFAMSELIYLKLESLEELNEKKFKMSVGSEVRDFSLSLKKNCEKVSRGNLGFEEFSINVFLICDEKSPDQLSLLLQAEPVRNAENAQDNMINSAPILLQLKRDSESKQLFRFEKSFTTTENYSLTAVTSKSAPEVLKSFEGQKGESFQ